MAKKRPKMKLPNGFGSITNLSGNRRNPFMVCVTTGWDNTGKQIREPIGYVSDWWDGYDMLREYHKNPDYLDNLKKSKIIVDSVFEALDLKLQTIIGKPGMSKSNYKNLRSAYLNQCKNIHQRPILQLTYSELQDLIDNCNRSQTTKGYIKNIIIRIFEYAKLNMNIKVDLEIAEKLEVGEKVNSEMHSCLTNEELKAIWDDYAIYPCKETEIALMLFAGGLRPQELIDIKLYDVFLDEHYMRGGCKTRAGKDRVIPIHDDIFSFIKKRKDSNQTFLIENIPGKKTTYKYINKAWSLTMERIKANHYPYDARHTMVTKLDEYRLTHPNSLIDDYFIKKFIGHSITDNVTQNVYTHRDIKYFVEAINLINLKGGE